LARTWELWGSDSPSKVALLAHWYIFFMEGWCLECWKLDTAFSVWFTTLKSAWKIGPEIVNPVPAVNDPSQKVEVASQVPHVFESPFGQIDLEQDSLCSSLNWKNALSASVLQGIIKLPSVVLIGRFKGFYSFPTNT
jgi:hypothetical protein